MAFSLILSCKKMIHYFMMQIIFLFDVLVEATIPYGISTVRIESQPAIGSLVALDNVMFTHGACQSTAMFVDSLPLLQI